MKKIFILVFVTLSMTAQSQNTINDEINTVLPPVNLIAPTNVMVSVNGKYAVLAQEEPVYKYIVFSIYDLKKRQLIKSGKVSFDKSRNVEGLSNDGRYIQFDVKGYSDALYYDVVSTQIIEEDDLPAGTLFSRWDIKRFDVVDEWIDSIGEDYPSKNIWVKNDYIVCLKDKSVLTYHWPTQKADKIEYEVVAGPNFFNDELAISPNGRWLVYEKKKVLHLVDLFEKREVWSSSVSFGGIEDLRVNDDQSLVMAGRVESWKMKILWYNPLTDKILFSTEQDQLLNIPYASQFSKNVSVAYGTTDKKKVERAHYLDLTNGNPSTLTEKKRWRGFDDIQKYVKDTLSRAELSNEEFDRIKASRTYFRLSDFYYDFYDKKGELKEPSRRPPIDTSFFPNMDTSLLNYQIIYALDNKVSYRDISEDYYFGPLMSNISQNKAIYFWNGDIPDPELRKVTYIMTADETPIFFTPDNYYMSTGAIGNDLGFEQNMNFYPIEQFDIKYNRPDIILERLGYADSTTVEAYRNAYQKRLRKMGFNEDMLKGDFHLPELEIANKDQIPSISSTDQIEISLRISDGKYPLDRVNLWINDVPIHGIDGISLKRLTSQKLDTTLTISMARGKNKIQVSVLNQAGAESFKETINIECIAGKVISNLYLISIGSGTFAESNYNLNYAAKDAQDMAKLLQNSKAFEKVYTKTLVGTEVTRTNVLSLDSFLKESEINDQVIVFLAGHGLIDNNLEYFLSTYELDFANPAKDGLLYDDLENLLDGIKPLKKMLILDACHSGEIDKEEVLLASSEKALNSENIQFRAVGNSVSPKLGVHKTAELSQSLFSNLRRGTGASVLSSAGGMELAIESDEWKNGLFTYCFMEGITSKKADLNGDGEIWFSEIKKYVSEKVSYLSHGRQQPTSRMDNQAVDYRVW